ncbi:4Fe-4S dicluster domain-containing protein [uncultured Desulfuromonas sp.]|uniref:4Fe-4S dicluster domain-containing protein n=1 Tax=uncultured Desulfuromonas sp. TaxID=181013 RepID=UPI002AAB6808|nr:4Fe-4S dicluster domain-containing protein [uncultured Desulfuromonas sp.]
MNDGLERVIVFDPQRCNQCHGCEIACKNWRGLDAGIFYRRVLSWWEPRNGEEKMRTLSLTCLHCVNPACVTSCPVSALTKNTQDGRVEVDATLCIGCGACARACDYGVPQITTQQVMKKCDLCMSQPFATNPPCIDSCPGGALSLRELTSAQKSEYERWCQSVMCLLSSRCGSEPRRVVNRT